jgi:nuclear autoantigenic sperm protein
MAGTTPPLDVASLTAEADESFAKGVAAIKAGTMDEAIELLARALELKTTLHGEQAIECAASYFRYGCALFYKAQDENTVFGKQAQAQASAKDDADKRKPQIANETAVDDGEACDDDDDEKDGEDKEDGEDDDEEEDDMELAWKLVENARLIYEEDESHPIELGTCWAFPKSRTTVFPFKTATSFYLS